MNGLADGPRPSLFLSYARADDEPFVARLHQDLRQRGFPAWWDRTDMPSRGNTFLAEIADAIDAADWFIAVCGPAYRESEVCRAELDHAHQSCVAVIPILCLGDYADIPADISMLHAPDFRNPDEYGDALGGLLRHLAEEVPRPGRLLGQMPIPPSWSVPRDAVVGAVDLVVRASDLRPVGLHDPASVVVLHGEGGIGKTTLASMYVRRCETRRTFTDGVIWVEVGPEPSTTARQRDIGDALGDSQRNEYADVKQGKARLQAMLHDKAVLLVLDDVWDYRDVQPLIVDAPNCRYLVTTRIRRLAAQLSVPGPARIGVDLLTEEEGISLIAQRLGYRATDDYPYRDDHRAIVRLLGGHAQAIGICAARLDSMLDGPDYAPRLRARLARRLAEEGEDPFRDLELGGPDDRAYNLEASLSLSYEDLSADMRRRFRALGVFAPKGTFDERAAAAAWADDDVEEAHDALQELAARSLVQRSSADRYAYHDLVRLYARALVLRSQEQDVLARRHFEHYRRLYGDPNANRDETRHPSVHMDFANIQHAIGWGFDQAPLDSMDLVLALAYYLELRQPADVQRELLQAAYDVAKASRHAGAQAQALLRLGLVAFYRDEHNAARSLLCQSLEVAERAGDLEGQANAIYWLGRLALLVDDYGSARPYLVRSQALYGSLDDRRGQADVSAGLGLLEYLLDHYALSRGHCERALSLYEETHERRGQADTLSRLGLLDLMADRYDHALTCFERAQDLYQAIGDRMGQAYAFERMGRVKLMLDEYDAARPLLGNALQLCQQIGDKRGQADALDTLGQVELFSDRYREACRCYERAIALCLEVRDRSTEAVVLSNLAEAEFLLDRYEMAGAHLERAVAISAEIDSRWTYAWAMLDQGDLARRRGDYHEAEELLRKSLAVLAEIGDHTGQGWASISLGELRTATGDYAEAEARLDWSLKTYEQVGDQHGLAYALKALGILRLRQEATDEAQEHLARALAVFREIPGNRDGEGVALQHLADIARRRGEYDEAERLFAEAASLFDEIGTGYYRAVLETQLAELRVCQGRVAEALCLLWEALEFMNAHELRADIARIRHRVQELASDVGPSFRSIWTEAIGGDELPSWLTAP